MLLTGKINAQSSFDLLGGLNNQSNSRFRLNGLESNPYNLSGVKDWEFSIMYGSELPSGSSAGINAIALSKRIGLHYMHFRYTPGYRKEFIFNSATSISVGDTIKTQLKSHLQYAEKFGFGYSYELKPGLTAGFSFRYFSQEFSSDEAGFRYDTSGTVIDLSTSKSDYNFWTGDLGFSYSPFGGLSLSASSSGLINIRENSKDEEFEPFSLKNDKSLRFGAVYSPVKGLSLNGLYETGYFFMAGFNVSFPLAGGSLSLSSSIFHDKYQNPYIAGIIPAVNYSYGFVSVSLSAVRYFSDRNGSFSLKEFTAKGLHNIVNNSYSNHKAVLSVSFALNTRIEKQVRFLDVKVAGDLFPAFSDNYLDEPFAYGKIVNLTGKAVTVKPESTIPGFSQELVQSPEVIIAPYDTMDVPFYTILHQENPVQLKAEIAQASFFITASEKDPDDEFRRPVLINSVNSWDGRVSNLRYFIWKDFDRTLASAREAIAAHKNEIDTIPDALADFHKAKILFNSFISRMVYVTDPRASADRVQFPQETFSLKGGDCDDLSVAYSALLESAGIATAFVDYRSDNGISHVNLLFNTGLTAEQAAALTANDRKYVLRKDSSGRDEVWIPVEVTSLAGFDDAWSLAAEKFNREALDELGLAKGKVQIVEVF